MSVIRQILDIGVLLSMLASLLGISGEAPANRQSIQSLLAPGNNVVASVPANPVDESAVPHYYGPWPNWANSPFTLPDATVTITGDGAGATAEASVGVNGMVTGITITNPGSGYTAATVDITGLGTGATADATVTLTGIVTAINITTPGSGYTAPSVLIGSVNPGGATTQATATAYGGVDAVTLIGGVDYSGFTLPTVDFDYPDDPNGTMPKAHVTCAEANCLPVAPATTVTVVGVVVDDPGSGYSAAPGVAILDGTQGNPINNRADRATAGRADAIKANTEGAVAAEAITPSLAPTAPAASTLTMQYVIVNTFGAGYTSAPDVLINDPTGAGAAAQAFVDSGGVTAITVTAAGSGYLTAGGMKKFVDPMPGLCDPAGVLAPTCPTEAQLAANPLGKALPIGVADTSGPYQTTPDVSDTYEIALVQFRMSFSSSLPPTTLVRGYVQLETPANAGVSQHVQLFNEMLDGSKVPVLVNGQQAYGITPPQYLGPVIVTPKNHPVRIVFRNMLPTGDGGDMFLPVDTTLMGSGMGTGWENYDPVPVPGGTVMDETRNPRCTSSFSDGLFCFLKNRATLHLHGGNTPWISDGTPHQWISPAGETTTWPQGVSVGNVPDMNVCTAADDGCQTFYYTNQQSARIMFYHDHAYGLTRLNVYAGEAAGYLITDDTEADLIAAGGALEGLGIGTPLIVQDKTFVPQIEQLDWQDPTWDYDRWGGYGNLWYHHVYMPAQNPGDPGGMSGFGRWMYGPWFWPPAGEAKYGPIANPYYGMDPNADPPFSQPLATPCSFDDPSTWQYDEDPFCEPPLIPGTPNISAGMEQFNDTPLVNGTAYPTLTVEPKAYRFRMLNAANDRFFNLQWYVGDPSTASTDLNLAGQPIGPTEVALDETLVALAQTDGAVFPIPDMDPTLPGGAPDSSFSLPGPDWVVIGSEGGFLPAPVLRDGQQETTWITDPTVFHVGTVDLFSLLLSPAERADVVVDFSQFAGQTLILYNDAPAAFPARITSYDYFTGAPDMRPVGAPPILPGYGPNTRTVMQVKVAAAVSNPADPALGFNLPELNSAFSHKADGSGVFESGQHPIIVGQAAYNSAYGTSFVTGGWCNSPTSPSTRCDGYARISEQGGDMFKFDTLNKDMFGNPKQVSVKIEPKAIHDETNASAFDEFGRMQANLGLEVVPATPMLQNVVLHPYIFPATEMVDTTLLPKATVQNANGTFTDIKITPISVGSDGSQIWKFTHNGVDTHPIHFHAYDVQTLNRVSWDNVVMPPDATELGWKDTLRISPLMDTIVALRPVVPTLPWDVPNSIRLINPAMQDGVSMILSSAVEALGMGQTAFAPNGQPIDVYNHFVNFGAEYVYHCHILSHEEMDMMRPVSLAYPPVAPTNLAVSAPTGTGATRGVDLTWTDNSRSETNWLIERATSLNGPWTTLVMIPSDPANPGLTDTTGESIGGTITYRDLIGTTPLVYAYRVQAVNVVGDTWNYADPAFNNIDPNVPAFPVMTLKSASSNAASWSTAPAAPTLLSATNLGRVNNTNRIRLIWTAVPGVIGYTLQRSTDPTFTAGVTSINRPPNATQYLDTVPRLPVGTRYYYRIQALSPLASAWSNVLSIVTQ